MKTDRIEPATEKTGRNALLVGIGSLIWLLYRSATKPSRLRYPCQQVCLANVSTLLPPALLALAGKILHSRRRWRIGVVLGALCVVALGITFLSLAHTAGEGAAVAKTPPGEVAVPSHGVLGIRLDAHDAAGRPVYATSPQALTLPVPNRVVSVHDSRATNWDHATGYHWETIDQGIVDNMVARGVMALTDRTNTVDAWNDLIPYQPGDQVVLKINFNNSGCADYDNDIDGYAETVNAVVDGLTSIGVPPADIWITDPSRRVPERFRNRITNPNVHFFSRYSCSGPNYHAVEYVTPESPHASTAQCPAGERILPSQVFVDAEHLINIPQLKSHGHYVTLALKNHYGSVIYRDNDLGSMHAYFYPGTPCELETENILADINDNPHIRDKTRLVIGEGLFGNPFTNWQGVERWEIFGQDDPNILFFSGDPVAISSVMTDYLIAERQITQGDSQDHDQLHAAAGLGLGVHDHWDSFENKHYSAIDYQIIDLDEPAAVTLQGAPADRAIHLNWEVNVALPASSTWHIEYFTQTLTPPLVQTNIVSLTRSTMLTDLTNYIWYTVTLSTVGVTPPLSDTVRVRPTDQLVFLPLARKGDY